MKILKIATLIAVAAFFSPATAQDARSRTGAASAETRVAAAASPTVQQILDQAHAKFKDDASGKNADYIPFLANVPSGLFGLAVMTADGKIYKAGDSGYEFGIESISKIFVLAQAMQTVGPEFIADSIGTGATGLPFNSVIAIELEGYKPVSPIVNAGAMATNSLIKGASREEQFTKILAYMGDMANRKLSVIDELYRSEAATNQHNRAIAMLLDAYGHMWSDPLDACDSYTRQCSIGVTAEDLANMGAVLANGGVHPVTGKRSLNSEYVPKVLAIMGMEGLYESTGPWMYRVGVPAKSGVGGGIVAVIPGRMAIAAFAPPVDGAGNSVRAQKAIEYIATQLEANVYGGK